MQGRNLTSDLIPYIAGAAMLAFVLDFCAQPFGTGVNASDRIGIQREAAQPVNIVDRSHKGDRLSSSRQISGQAATGGVAIGTMEPLPAKASLVDVPLSPTSLPKLPEGCESAFSTLSAAEQKDLAARCFT
jgi:hypothetical protein